MEKLYTAIHIHLSNAHGIDSLRLQNHIYGCYILLEDIVQQYATLSGMKITGQSFSFDLKQQFSEIGLRYGFAMDTQLLLGHGLSDYQDSWIHAFTTIKTLEEVDSLEEKVNAIIQQVVPADYGFFVSTAETGSLPPLWIERALNLLLPKPVAAPVSIPTEQPRSQAESVPSKSVDSLALLEKHKDNPKRMFASTRRKKPLFMTPNKILATTRRAPKA
jgi:hypothetical protein